MSNEILRKYVRLALECGGVESYEYNMCQIGGDDMIHFNLFYAKNEDEYFMNILKKDIPSRDDVIDEMKYNEVFNEDDEITIDDLLKNFELTKKYLKDKYEFQGEGYYDFWEWELDHCERIEKIMSMIEEMMKDGEKETGKKPYRRVLEDKEFEEKMRNVLEKNKEFLEV